MISKDTIIQEHQLITQTLMYFIEDLELKYQREINGYTQNALAKATGLKQQMISWWEAGNGLPNIDFCVQLADFYGISVDELIGHEIKK